jgi:hypothetical protein
VRRTRFRSRLLTILAEAGARPTPSAVLLLVPPGEAQAHRPSYHTKLDEVVKFGVVVDDVLAAFGWPVREGFNRFCQLGGNVGKLASITTVSQGLFWSQTRFDRSWSIQGLLTLTRSAASFTMAELQNKEGTVSLACSQAITTLPLTTHRCSRQVSPQVVSSSSPLQQQKIINSEGSRAIFFPQESPLVVRGHQLPRRAAAAGHLRLKSRPRHAHR